jgi:hypothetical protein
LTPPPPFFYNDDASMKKIFTLLLAAVSLILAGSAPAAPSGVVVTGNKPGATPFIAFVGMQISGTANLSSIQFVITPKSGSQTRPFAATFSSGYLQKRGYFNPKNGKANLPVFGLYSNYLNAVALNLKFADGSTQNTTTNIQTAAYDGGTYSMPIVIQPRLTNTTLSYDFIMLKSYAMPNTPIIIDSDAEIRWIGTANIASSPSAFFENGFYVTSGTALYRNEFDGSFAEVADYSSLGVIDFHHNIDFGKTGLILDIDTTVNTECINYEVDGKGNVLKTWNYADIVSATMTAGGDDPNQFVNYGTADWFHNNATVYRALDNSLVVSSRENFVMAIDYDSGAMKWILGDPTKKWFEFKSLRSLAYKLGKNSLPPAGQHAVSVPGSEVMVFDDGTGSAYQMPPGVTRTYSAPRRYNLDDQTGRATEVWHYLHDPSIYSPYCSSVYEDAKDNYLVDYTLGGPYIFTELVGLDAAGNTAFDYQYQELDNCGTAFYATPQHFENLQFK